MSTPIEPSLVELWRSARVWIDIPTSGAVEVVPNDKTERAHYPRGIGAVYVVTAWNPGAQALSFAENSARHDAFVDDLDHNGVDHWAAAGYSEDRSWIELGLALPDVAEATVLELGRRFGQLALYRWTLGELAVLDCRDGIALATYGWSARPCPERPEVPAVP
jgi:hypothetical protein